MFHYGLFTVDTHIDSLVQDYNNSTDNAMELL